jgi:hypothetical protein
MNISNLIEKLIAERLEHGDLEVTVWADHGQTNTLAHMWVYSTGIRMAKSLRTKISSSIRMNQTATHIPQ